MTAKVWPKLGHVTGQWPKAEEIYQRIVKEQKLKTSPESDLNAVLGL